jgi:iron complex outermembrane receptor protein
MVGTAAYADPALQAQAGASTGAAASQSDPQASPAGASAPGAAPAGNGNGLEEILVTARRQIENLQKVPTSVTSFSAQTLRQNNITLVTDIGRHTPSMSFAQSTYGPLGAFVAIRGQRPTDLTIVLAPAVGFYVDDVYQPSTLSINALGLDDAASVEVLKGPQGTLYGRNTTGGALKIMTPLPDYNEVTGNARLGVGNMDDRRASAAVSVPIVDDKIALRVSGNYERNHGYGRDLSTDSTLGAINERSIRGTLRMKLSDNFEAILRGDALYAKGTSSSSYLDAAVPGGPLVQSAAFFFGLPFTQAGLNQAYTMLMDRYANPQGFDREFNGPAYQVVKEQTQSLTLTWNVASNLTFKSISAHQHLVTHINGDTDQTPISGVDGNFENQNYNEYTEELQAIGKAFDDKLSYTVGYFYYRMDGKEPAFANLLFPLTGQVIVNNAHLVDTSNSGYAQVKYNLFPHVRLNAGIRYTHETNPITLNNFIKTPTGDVCNIPPIYLKSAACVASFNTSASNWSYTAGIDADITQGVLAYAKTSRGFKAGGVNSHSSSTGILDAFKPEQVTDYELGLKAEFWDHRARVNLAGYISKYDNIQRSVLVLGLGGAPTTQIQNAASATIKGIEAEITLRPVPGLTINASGSYTDPKYDRYVDELTGQDLSHNVFPGIAKWTGTLSASYRMTTPLGPLTTSLDATYQSKVDWTPDEHLPASAFDNPANLLPNGQNPFPNGTKQYTMQSGYALVSGRVSLAVTDKVDVAVWVRNLTDKRYSVGGEDQSSGLGFIYKIPGMPRTYGLEVAMHF